MIDLPAPVMRNPTARLALRLLPNTVQKLTPLIGISRSSVRNAMAILMRERLVYISGFETKKGMSAPIYSIGQYDNATRPSKKALRKIVLRRFYLKNREKIAAQNALRRLTPEQKVTRREKDKAHQPEINARATIARHRRIAATKPVVIATRWVGGFCASM